jgi:hypothetical protein
MEREMASMKRVLIAFLVATLAAILVAVIITVAIAVLTSSKTIPSNGTIMSAVWATKRILTRI